MAETAPVLVAPLRSIAAGNHDIVAFQRVPQLRQQFGRVLQVCIHDAQDISIRISPAVNDSADQTTPTSAYQ
jgi:hypothetical protein